MVGKKMDPQETIRCKSCKGTCDPWYLEDTFKGTQWLSRLMHSMKWIPRQTFNSQSKRSKTQAPTRIASLKSLSRLTTIFVSYVWLLIWGIITNFHHNSVAIINIKWNIQIF